MLRDVQNQYGSNLPTPFFLDVEKPHGFLTYALLKSFLGLFPHKFELVFNNERNWIYTNLIYVSTLSLYFAVMPHQCWQQRLHEQLQTEFFQRIWIPTLKRRWLNNRSGKGKNQWLMNNVSWLGRVICLSLEREASVADEQWKMTG